MKFATHEEIKEMNRTERRIEAVKYQIKLSVNDYKEEHGWDVPEVLQEAVYEIIKKNLNEELELSVDEYRKFLQEKVPFVLRNVVMMATF